MIQVAICDDTESDIELLSRALVAYDPSLKMRTFRNGNLLIDALMDSEFNADILFLDIYMPGLDGIKTAEKIREIKKDVKIIF
ncbi:MAG: two-component system, LytTR family, response regulator LytT, partial [Clostridiales bacterium]|nr:two-component system, LytTR family, response regulator LytT [Clostridiales bacterium]